MLTRTVKWQFRSLLGCNSCTMAEGNGPVNWLSYYNLRTSRKTAPGQCLYIQSGDPTDFDGYLVAAAGALASKLTPNCRYAVVMPERRACNDKTKEDPMTHIQEYSETVLETAGSLIRHLCPDALIVRGPLNERAIIPIKFAFDEPGKYGPLLQGREPAKINWQTIEQLAEAVGASDSVVVDVFGSLGYLPELASRIGEEALARKLKASGMPVVVMAGIYSEVQNMLMPLPNRDRATSNSLYSPQGTKVLLQIAKQQDVPLLFITNNMCNEGFKFEEHEEMLGGMSLNGKSLLKDVADIWYGLPHLKGKVVPFDWPAFAALLLYGRSTGILTIEERELYVGDKDPAILILRPPGERTDPKQQEFETANLKDTSYWGRVQSIKGFDRDAMMKLASALSHNLVQ